MPSKEELFKLLNLSEEVDRDNDPIIPLREPVQDPRSPDYSVDPSVKLHDHCLKLDKWDRAIGKNLWTHRETGLELPEEAFADFHGLAFLNRLTPIECHDRVRQAFVRSLLDSPDLKAMRATTVLN